VRNEWKTTRRALNDYVAAASKRIGPREETYFDICGKVEKLRSQGLNPPLSMIGDGKLTTFQEREQFLLDAGTVDVPAQANPQEAWMARSQCRKAARRI